MLVSSEYLSSNIRKENLKVDAKEWHLLIEYVVDLSWIWNFQTI